MARLDARTTRWWLHLLPAALVLVAGTAGARDATQTGPSAAPLTTLPSPRPDAGLPPGWFYAGPPGAATPAWEYGTCRAPAVILRAGPPQAGAQRGASTVMQEFRAEPFRGRRLRFAGLTTTRDVQGSAGLWMRVDGPDRRRLAWDGMQPRPLTGTTPCRVHAVVLDVPRDAVVISLGLRLEGPGEVELADVSIEAVSELEPSTDLARPPTEDDSLGRVGELLFSHRAVNQRLGRQGVVFKDGAWTGSATARLVQGVVEASIPPHTGRLTLRREGEATVIEGSWGTSVATYPVKIRYSRTRVDMTWGFYQRHLTREEAPQLAEDCVYYSQRLALRSSDELELCGAVLDADPPPVQTVLAFLWNGFRRATPSMRP